MRTPSSLHFSFHLETRHSPFSSTPSGPVRFDPLVKKKRQQPWNAPVSSRRSPWKRKRRVVTWRFVVSPPRPPLTYDRKSFD